MILPETKAFLTFLRNNKPIRDQIRAAPDKTLLYAGTIIPNRRAAWQEIERLKGQYPDLADHEILPDILKRIPVPGTFPHLHAWVSSIDPLSPWDKNGFFAWRALSGIFASNAVGKVSFCIGSEVRKDNKVFAATEIAVLARNPNIDNVTRDALAYYQRCLQNKNSAMNLGFFHG